MTPFRSMPHGRRYHGRDTDRRNAGRLPAMVCRPRRALRTYHLPEGCVRLTAAV